MLKGLNDFLDKHEGRKVGSSTKAIMKERKRQGYDKSTPRSKALKGERRTKGRMTILNEKGDYETKNYKINRRD